MIMTTMMKTRKMVESERMIRTTEVMMIRKVVESERLRVPIQTADKYFYCPEFNANKKDLLVEFYKLHTYTGIVSAQCPASRTSRDVWIFKVMPWLRR